MTRDDIIRMAREANILELMEYDNPHMKQWQSDVVRELERFAALVAAAEREACAKACESTVWACDIIEWGSMTKKDVSARSMHECAAAIRARGQS